MLTLRDLSLKQEYRSDRDDVVAFSGTSNVTFDAENRNFESVDVFTSWDDKSREVNKIKTITNYLSKPIEMKYAPVGI